MLHITKSEAKIKIHQVILKRRCEYDAFRISDKNSYFNFELTKKGKNVMQRSKEFATWTVTSGVSIIKFRYSQESQRSFL